MEYNRIMDNMEALHTAIISLFNVHSGGSDAITGHSYVDFDIAREKLLSKNGVTMSDYLDWCEAQEAAYSAA